MNRHRAGSTDELEYLAAVEVGRLGALLDEVLAMLFGLLRKPIRTERQ